MVFFLFVLFSSLSNVVNRNASVHMRVCLCARVICLFLCCCLGFCSASNTSFFFLATESTPFFSVFVLFLFLFFFFLMVEVVLRDGVGKRGRYSHTHTHTHINIHTRRHNRGRRKIEGGKRKREVREQTRRERGKQKKKKGWQTEETNREGELTPVRVNARDSVSYMKRGICEGREVQCEGGEGNGRGGTHTHTQKQKRSTLRCTHTHEREIKEFREEQAKGGRKRRTEKQTPHEGGGRD